MLFNQINFGKLFKTDHIFEITPSSEGLYQYLSILFILLIIFSAFIWRFNKRKSFLIKKRYNRLASLFLTIGILGEIIIFFRWQQIAYLGSRLMLILLALSALIWLVFELLDWFFILPKQIKKDKEKENFEKYLPRRQTGLPRAKSRG